MDLSQKRYIFKRPNLSLFIFQIIDNQLSSSPKLPKAPQKYINLFARLQKKVGSYLRVFTVHRDKGFETSFFIYIYNKQK